MKVAAIWARVSTSDQRELSLDGQVERCKAKLESLGYVVPPDRILKVDWTSMDLYSCPDFQKLLGWIKAKEIPGLGILDRDRLEAKGLQRLTFLSECKEAGVELVVCQGPPILDEPEGQLVELALAIGKERQVLRAQQGARDGLRDRARLKGLPPSPKNPYGYAWDSTRTRLQPTPEWPNAQFICRAALEGWTLGAICEELHRRGVPTPTGKEWWAKQTIGGIVSNPLYGARFYALRGEATLPKKRRNADSYGKTTERRKSLEEALYLPRILVENPPLTWEEWLAVQKRLERNKLLAQRNGKRDYLLRGLILCETHRYRYHGQPQRDSWRYTCPARYKPGMPPCPTPYLNSSALEAQVKAICQDILTRPEVIEAEVARRTGQVQETVVAIERRLAVLDRQEAEVLTTETRIVLEGPGGKASPEAYDRALSLLKAKRAWIAEERQRLQGQLATAQQREQVVLGLSEVRGKLVARLERGGNADWREVFTALGLEIRVGQDGMVEVALAIPARQTPIVASTPRASSPSPNG